MALQVTYRASAYPMASSSYSSSCFPCLNIPMKKNDGRINAVSSSFLCSSSSSSYLYKESHRHHHHDGNNRSDRRITIPKAVEQVGSDTARSGGVAEVTQETFWTVVEAAADRLVVLDMYTQWCGPCKIMYPKVVELSLQHSDVLFLKLDCNQENKALAKSLGVKTVPTFKLFKNRKEIAEVKGAKFDELVQKIELAKTGNL